MLKKLKISILGLGILGLFLTALVYGLLSLSLPSLSGKTSSKGINSKVSIERDKLGIAIINADNRQDAAYGLGYAHGQDRFFQMDLLRRNAAGELSELFGKAAIPVDKKHRFHQFRKRAEKAFSLMPEKNKKLLKSYALGVNEAVAQIQYPSFEYMLSGAKVKPWLPVDSLLVIYTMYLDLQTNTFKRDLTLTQVEKEFGTDMLAFITQPSEYQVALDGSKLPEYTLSIPDIPKQKTINMSYHKITEPLDIGSNNWAVTGALTKTGHGMLSDDMHLSLRVPVIWYRAQLNYNENNDNRQINGVSLPGTPAIVVGTNSHIAWGFTNGYLDTADWYKLSEQDETYFITQDIKLPQGSEPYILEMSDYGPVKILDGEKYALTWVAHQEYAVDMELMNLEGAKTVKQALDIATTIGIPVQNMLVVDRHGDAAWKPAGAVPGRLKPMQTAGMSEQYSASWSIDEIQLPQVLNPENNRLWTANARVISTEQLKRFGNGAYAMGARAQQIKMRLFEKSQFSESDFYKIQLDNQALFLKSWHKLLTKVLSAEPTKYKEDLKLLSQWGECACSDSAGYTLVRHYRAALIDEIFAPIENALIKHDLSLAPVKRDLEPGVWQLISQFPDSWLTEKHASWPQMMINTYQDMRKNLLNEYGANERDSLHALAWGKVNALKLQHPFSKQMPFLSSLLDMPTASGFGDSFMPAVQKSGFGASQRFFVQPGLEENAILTIPGGQSGHPLSPFYRAGFDDYIKELNTPLLPGEVIHRIEISPNQ
ncbi:penicillin acylase family protein [Pseudoalteromonas denitrificans]|uniref:Penicillin amidase n=1 Tax=Pseudoalteromonas denitrificans DSM 6059 TaxID=1123010 RepID=A0A1I1M9N2_9GAMM|nr:penicillin acylase family protein [Pseudoalteromonas denitrificans]SFC82064.1 penicillin amidase [Pseudoalteromonas denitrificans DSM 6059]